MFVPESARVRLGFVVAALVFIIAERRKTPSELERVPREAIATTRMDIERLRYGRRKTVTRVVLVDGRVVPLAARGVGAHELYHAVHGWLGN